MALAGQSNTYYEIHTEGTCHEVYTVSANSEEEARLKFENGDVTEPLVSEVVSCEITSVKERGLDG